MATVLPSGLSFSHFEGSVEMAKGQHPAVQVLGLWFSPSFENLLGSF